ncbi:MAG: S46 family peptidase [Deltaproteobacteria bacterium]|nr:MAG: S46 family peptidase [Deltaproteobacteria bacterium]
MAVHSSPSRLQRRARPVGLVALVACAVAPLFLADPVVAGEGMWLPEQLPAVSEDLRAAGLTVDADRLADLEAPPLGAIVSLGGCSAAFVSGDGLVLTNHHCAEGALTLNSSAEENLWRDGFLAANRTDERWAGPGSRVFVTTESTDVSEAMFAARDGAADDLSRWEAMDRQEKALVAECEEGGPWRCRVAPMFNGTRYLLIRQLEIEDVRIVYAPSEGIGFYGGDEDNWRWPRHTGDFTVFRAYVGPDGVPAPHHEDNVPYRPAHHLEIGTAGVSEGDFVMVAGYPGRTFRYRTADEMRFARDVSTPWQIERMQDVLAILDARMDEDDEARVRLNSMRFGLANFEKYSRGILDGITSSGAVARSVSREQAMREALRATADARALEALDELAAVIERGQADDQRERLFSWMRWNVRMLGAAGTLWRLSGERDKADDLERDAGFQERDWPRIRERMERLDRSLDAVADQRLLAYWMAQAALLPETARIEAVDALLERFAGEDDPAEAAAHHVLSGTALTGPEARIEAFEASRASLAASDDPLIALARDLSSLEQEILERSRARAGAESRLRPVFMSVLQESAGTELYPDANGTLRVTFGQVRGYDGPDAVTYRPQTTLAGLLEKERGEAPFASPPQLLDAIRAAEPSPWHCDALGSVPVNFLSTLDTTGGNSGSATLDRNGRLVGLLFDGNYEAMASDWVFDPVRTRSIHVDVRYMLWVMDRVDGAHHVLREMGVEPSFISAPEPAPVPTRRGRRGRR